MPSRNVMVAITALNKTHFVGSDLWAHVGLALRRYPAPRPRPNWRHHQDGHNMHHHNVCLAKTEARIASLSHDGKAKDVSMPLPTSTYPRLTSVSKLGWQGPSQGDIAAPPWVTKPHSVRLAPQLLPCTQRCTTRPASPCTTASQEGTTCRFAMGAILQHAL